jgi:two-component system LytT family response regulator
MKNIKTAIVDDERLARLELRNMLLNYSDIEIVGEYTGADELLSEMESIKPDLLFLDIQMPGKTGFDILEELDKVPQVVFVTAYDEYAIKAFEVNALDYILKPVEEGRLQAAIERVRNRLRESDHTTTEIQQLTGNDRVFVKDGDRCWFVCLKDVRMFESIGNYARLYFDGNKPMILKSLNNLDKRLDQKEFFRANRKMIINLQWIEKIEPWFNGGLLVELRGGDKIEVSRRQALKLKDRMSL